MLDLPNDLDYINGAQADESNFIVAASCTAFLAEETRVIRP